MEVKIEESWKELLQDEFDKEYFKKLTNFVREEYVHHSIFPSPKNIFRAFEMCPVDKVKVVILGQDPYHDVDQANGLCFSVNDGITIPPSLRNIYKEIKNDLGKEVPSTGNLDRWAKQGVLLLNATLTVEAHKAGSHQNKGWEEFTDAAIKKLSEKRDNLVFILWGSYAQKKGMVIADGNRHLILKSPHPSPLSASRGFFGCKHFSKANEYLEECGKKPIDW